MTSPWHIKLLMMGFAFLWAFESPASNCIAGLGSLLGIPKDIPDAVLFNWVCREDEIDLGPTSRLSPDERAKMHYILNYKGEPEFSYERLKARAAAMLKNAVRYLTSGPGKDLSGQNKYKLLQRTVTLILEDVKSAWMAAWVENNAHTYAVCFGPGGHFLLLDIVRGRIVPGQITSAIAKDLGINIDSGLNSLVFEALFKRHWPEQRQDGLK